MIPAEAVEAAARHLAFYTDRPGTDWTVEARELLEAAAPHILAAAVEAAATDLTELARLLLKDAYELQSHPGTKDICQHLTDAAIALDVIRRGLSNE